MVVVDVVVDVVVVDGCTASAVLGVGSAGATEVGDAAFEVSGACVVMVSSASGAGAEVSGAGVLAETKSGDDEQPAATIAHAKTMPTARRGR